MRKHLCECCSLAAKLQTQGQLFPERRAQIPDLYFIACQVSEAPSIQQLQAGNRSGRVFWISKAVGFLFLSSKYVWSICW